MTNRTPRPIARPTAAHPQPWQQRASYLVCVEVRDPDVYDGNTRTTFGPYRTVERASAVVNQFRDELSRHTLRYGATTSVYVDTVFANPPHRQRADAARQILGNYVETDEQETP